MFDLQVHVTCSTKISRGTTANGTKFINFSIPHMKTNADGVNINVSDSTCNCSAIIAFKHDLSSNSLIPTPAPLFTFETSDGSWAPMRRKWFLNQCNKEGLTSIKGHSFHISGTMHLLLLRVDPWVVMAQGCWSSQSFLGYWHKCEEILALFIVFSYQSHESILNTMSAFKLKLTQNS